MITVKKKFKYVIAVILVLIMLVSCQPKADTVLPGTTVAPETTTPLVLPDGIVLAGTGIENACMIRRP